MSCLAKTITSSDVIHTGKCEFYGAILAGTTGTDDATAIVYDAVSAASPVIQKLATTVETGTANGILSFRVACDVGLYVALTGTTPSVTVYYRPELSL